MVQNTNLETNTSWEKKLRTTRAHKINTGNDPLTKNKTDMPQRNNRKQCSKYPAMKPIEHKTQRNKQGRTTNGQCIQTHKNLDTKQKKSVMRDLVITTKDNTTHY